MAKKGSSVVVRRGSSAASKEAARLRARLANVHAKRRMESRELLADVTAVGGGVLIGWLDTQKWAQKMDLIEGVDDAWIYGLASYVLGSNISGNWGGIFKGLGVGMLSCAARDLVNGDAK